MQLGPYPIKYAREWIKTVHRRLPDMTGAMWCVGLWEGSDMIGLAVVGRPNARKLDVPKRSRVKLQEILRVAVLPGLAAENGHKGACSMLYGACSRAGKAMGLDGLVTYIHADEPGTSLRAAGYVEGGPTDGGEWTRPSRQRGDAADPKEKIRWWAAWSKAVQPMTSERAIRDIREAAIARLQTR